MKRKFPIVGIGASAGGIEAFKTLFEAAPAKSGMAFVLIPHLDPGHKSLMVEIISRHTQMPVFQVEKQTKIAPDTIYIVQPNRNLSIENGTLLPLEIPRSGGINLPVDVFFHALAVEQKELAIGVVLSGTMSDGAMGIRHIKEHGGLVIAQTPDTAQHEGMPQSAISTGVVDLVLPVEKIPEAITSFLSHSYSHGEPRIREDELEEVLSVINFRSNNDFGCYKRNTLVRRTERRMGLRQIHKMSEYVDILKGDPDEADALMKDLLIGVTGFFREARVWKKLGNEILPLLLKKIGPHGQPRIWIPGCSTGEEAYTMAILIHDGFKRVGRRFSGQIFATDIDEEAIAKARSGLYPDSIAANVSSEHLSKYFEPEDGGYRVSKPIRESVVFAVQNLISDAPFSNLDIISCRNLLIYLEPVIQKKVIDLFHFSLRQGGYLILGGSETIGYRQDLFDTFSKELHIYQSSGSKKERLKLPVPQRSGALRSYFSGMRPEVVQGNLAQVMKTHLLKRFAPAAIMINKKSEIVNLYGPTEKYLHLPQGDPVLDLMTMIREGLRVKMRAAVHRTVKNSETVIVSNARVKRDKKFYPVRITVSPIEENDASSRLFLISFEDTPVTDAASTTDTEMANGEASLVRELEAELKNNREDLQNTIEELETSNEELKATNEEMMSMNEELQSSNEELQTSKEELQSLNEELNTVNAELRDKIEALENANNDLVNLMNSTEVATLFLNPDTSIRRFTPAAKALFNLIPTDVGRPIGDLSRRFSDDDLKGCAQKVMETLTPDGKEVQTEDGRWYIRRILPFLTRNKQVEGIVLTFTDVTEIKENELAIRKSRKQLREKSQLLDGVLKHTHMMAVYLDTDFNFLWVNQAYADTCNHKPSFFPGKNHFELYPNQENQEIFQQVVDTGKPLFVAAKPFEFPDQPERGVTYWDWSLVPTKNTSGRITGLVFTLVEVTEQIRSQKNLRESEERFRQLFQHMTSGVAVYDALENGEDFIFKDINRAAEKIDQVSRDELVGKSLCKTYPGVADFGLLDVLKRVWQTGTPETLPIAFYKDHRIEGWRENRIYKLPSGDVVALYNDVTDKKESEWALEKERELFKTIVDRIPVMLTRYDPDANMLFLNKEFERLVGWTTEEVQTIDMMEKVYPDPAYRKKAYQYMHEAITGWKEFDVTSKAGKIIRSEWSNIRLEDGTQIGIGIDLSERKKAEKALQESEERFRATFEQAAVGICHVDLSGQFLRFNKRFEKITGYSRTELLSAAWSDITHPDDLDIDLKEISDVLDGKAETYSIEKRLIKKDGNLVWVILTGSLLCSPSGSPLYFISVIEDITYRKEIERQLQQSQKLESIGNLAGGIAHDFNNILSSVLGFTEIALEEVPKNTSLEDNLQEVYSAGNRAKELVKQILAFARQSDEKQSPVQPSVIAKDVLKFIRSTIPTNIEIHQDIESESYIIGNAIQIDQILMNLVTNAAHAMEASGGVLNVSLKDKVLEGKDLLIGMRQGDYLELEVSDTGPGIPPEIIGSIFDPYFTTKGPGEGTGMGLATVHGIVESYGGKITVNSPPGKGSSFKIYLPITKKRKASIPQKAEPLPTGRERILFVDDEAPIAKMGSQMLKRLNYSVTTRTSSMDALDLFRSKPHGFDLVITDMTMPNLTGDRLAIELLKIRNDIPIILCTGYSRTISDEAASEIGIKAFAYKPVVMSELAKTVRNVLDEREK